MLIILETLFAFFFIVKVNVANRDVEAKARKIHRFPVGGKNGERKEIGSAILRRRTNRGSINLKK